jgi:hypothetical protein
MVYSARVAVRKLRDSSEHLDTVTSPMTSLRESRQRQRRDRSTQDPLVRVYRALFR